MITKHLECYRVERYPEGKTKPAEVYQAVILVTRMMGVEISRKWITRKRIEK